MPGPGAWDGLTCEGASRHGHLRVLQWARAQGCEWNACTTAGAAAGGHLEILKWARAGRGLHSGVTGE